MPFRSYRAPYRSAVTKAHVARRYLTTRQHVCRSSQSRRQRAHLLTPSDRRIDPSTRLRRAILLDDVVLVARITRNHPTLLRNPDFADRSNTSLHLAAIHGFTAIAAHLLRAGHEQSEVSRNADHDTPLMLAAKHGHVDVGRLLVQELPHSIPMTNRLGLDALALAAQHPASTALIPFLLQNATHPASPHARDAEGNTPLHHASAAGALKALRLLLAAGANPLATNAHDWTPLAYSQTVAAEVYFKNLVAEFERRKVEAVRGSEERERQRQAGMRIVEDDVGVMGAAGAERGIYDDDEGIGDALKRNWSPASNKQRPMTPGSGPRHEWGSALSSSTLSHTRTRSRSGT